MARLLTCPDCGASYRVPDDALSPSGQTVRCQKCDGTWFVPGDETSTPDVLELEDLEADEKLARHVAPAPVGAIDMKAEAAAPPANDSRADRAPGQDGGRDAAAKIREGAHRKRRRRRVNIILLIWAGTAGLLLAALVIAVINRQAVVERYPQLATAFQVVGLEAEPSGFRLETPDARQVRLDGTYYLVVSGEVVNLSDRERPAPEIQLALLDVGGGRITEWSVEMNDTLGAGARADYVSEYPNPPLDAVRLSWSLAR